MVATEIVNRTKGILSLKYGNAGVFHDFKTLEVDEKFALQIDANRTYREYVVVSNPGGDKVFFTPDDCIRNSIITIIVDDSGKYVFTAVPRGNTKATDQVQGGFFAKILKKIIPGRK